jgi:hypothetical protein
MGSRTYPWNEIGVLWLPLPAGVVGSDLALDRFAPHLSRELDRVAGFQPCWRHSSRTARLNGDDVETIKDVRDPFRKPSVAL